MLILKNKEFYLKIRVVGCGWYYGMAMSYNDYQVHVSVERVSILIMHFRFSCAKGGFISLRHNKLRDITAESLSEVCNDVCVEPKLIPLTAKI